MNSDSKFLLVALAVVSALLIWQVAPCASLTILALLLAVGFAAVERRGR